MQDTIRNNGWATENEIVVPVHSADSYPNGMKPAAQKVAAPVYNWQQALWKAKADSAARARQDSIIFARNDSMAHVKTHFGIVLESPYEMVEAEELTVKTVTEQPQPGAGTGTPVKFPEGSLFKGGSGLSWVFVELIIIFVAVCLKFKNNPRYLKALFKDVQDVRTRHNLFDNTVKETTFLLLLNIMWIACAGVLLWKAIFLMAGQPNPFGGSFSIAWKPLPGIGICCGVAAAYVLLMDFAYFVVGRIFSDSRSTRMWLKGAGASIALEAFLFFPVSLVALCYPEWTEILLIIAAGVFLIGKILFIYKGFRIFFHQMSSWLLFLYYLCSLEIVPLILTYLSALFICAALL